MSVFLQYFERVPLTMYKTSIFQTWVLDTSFGNQTRRTKIIHISSVRVIKVTFETGSKRTKLGVPVRTRLVRPVSLDIFDLERLTDCDSTHRWDSRSPFNNHDFLPRKVPFSFPGQEISFSLSTTTTFFFFVERWCRN